jgi:hypothetical protein
MSFFGLFGGRKSPVEKHASRVADKRAQAPDRWESIQALGAMKSAEAVQALLPRFTFYADPSITDQQEKEEVYRLIVESGEPSIEPVLRFLRSDRTESLGWPLKILGQLMAQECVVAELLDLLGTMDTEYARDPTRKVQLLQALEDFRDERICGELLRFLEDVNESARFHAVATIFAQVDPTPARQAVQRALAKEISMRVRTRMLEALAERHWDVGAERAAVEKGLPANFRLDKAGVPQLKS